MGVYRAFFYRIRPAIDRLARETVYEVATYIVYPGLTHSGYSLDCFFGGMSASDCTQFRIDERLHAHAYAVNATTGPRRKSFRIDVLGIDFDGEFIGRNFFEYAGEPMELFWESIDGVPPPKYNVVIGCKPSSK